MTKQFKDLSDGQVFTLNGLQFKKTAVVKISCCRSINAEESTNANNRIFVNPNQEVEVDDQL
jgi:hypothetical protein